MQDTVDTVEDVCADTETSPDESPICTDVPASTPEPEPEPEQEIPVHPLAASFPLMEGEDLEALVEDIRANGQREPIELDASGQLIDGRNRLRACKLAGVAPTFVTKDVDDPIAYILSRNLHRRHADCVAHELRRLL
jgi:ParB-like chromosome segregation protein Spo0J